MDTASIPPPISPNDQHQRHHLALIVLSSALIISLYIITSLLFNFWPFERSAVAPTTETPPTISSDPTAGWKTYRNEQHGYEVRYPENLIIRVEPNNILFYTKGALEPENPEGLATASIAQLPNTKNLSAENYFKENYQTKYNQELNLSKPTTFNALSAWRFNTDRDSFILITHNDSAFLITNPDEPFLKTFRFTELTTQLDASSLKSYSDKNIGISFQYKTTLTTPILKNGVIVLEQSQIEGDIENSLTLTVRKNIPAQMVQKDATEYIQKNSDPATSGYDLVKDIKSLIKNQPTDIVGLYTLSGGLCAYEEAKLFIPQRNLELTINAGCSSNNLKELLQTFSIQ